MAGMDETWLTVQLAVTAALAGLCWTVQLAVYPLFARLIAAAGTEGFRGYHAGYTAGMGIVAAPLMLAELGLAGWWLAVEPGSAGAWIGVGLVGIIWIQTFGQMVPWHGRLQKAPDEALARRLAGWNWVRTIAWSARAAVLLGYLA
jgi:hypothetical protein